MISIVIPLYNKEKQVASALRSVINQTYQDFEIIVIDDGSTDNSVNEVKTISDPRIKLIRQENAGVSAARNRGITEAKGEYIAFLDADDKWHTDYLATQIELIQKYPQASVFATNYEFQDENDMVTHPIINALKFEKQDGLLDNYFEVATLSSPPLWTSAVLVTKEALLNVDGFPFGVRLGEDLITWAKLACEYKIAYTKKVCATYVFMSQKARVVPKKKPNLHDTVGEEYRNLVVKYNIPYIKNLAAKWHKMRMVTFVQLNMSKDARNEYNIIKSYISPTKKDRFWYLMSFMPMSFVRFFLKNKSKFS